MASEEAVDYVNKALAAGYSKEQIAQNLLGGGWTQQDIDEAIAAATTPQPAQPKAAATPSQQPTQPNQAAQPKKGRWKLIAAAVILVVAIVAGGIYYLNQNAGSASQTTANSSDVTIASATATIATGAGVDCGADKDCFVAAAEQCKQASVSWADQLNTPSVIVSAAALMQVKGFQDGKCLLYMKAEKSDFSFNETYRQKLLSSGKTETEIAQMLQQLQSGTATSVGRDGTCAFNSAAELAAMLKKWRTGILSTEDTRSADCTGSMFVTA